MVYAIIVAAGKGYRMQHTQPKQYLLLAGLPILVHTLRVFDTCDLIDQIVVVIPPTDVQFCRNTVIQPAKLTKEVICVPGGSKRQESVYHGLQAIKHPQSIVVIHDGVRPFLKAEHLIACINGAEQSGACILAIPAADTLKRVDTSHHVIQTLDRESIWLAQTPQVFRYPLIKKAHDTARKQRFTGTDDASLVERLGTAVKVIPGSYRNIKITNREDLETARAMLEMDFSES